MGLTTSLYTALTGLNANSAAINVAGNNIANANTTGFKSSRADFETQILQNLGAGTAPTADYGGTNPTQVGLGTKMAGTTRNLNSGTVQLTGVTTDIAIEGNGMFVLDVAGNARYTRSGAFGIDTDQKLVSSGGGRVQGYGVDGDFNITTGILSDLSIPLGNMTIAKATSTINFAGNLNGAGTAATTGTVIESDALFSDVGLAVPAVAGDLLANVRNSTGTVLFNTGDVITVTGATRGGAALPDKTFEVNAANTTASNDFGASVQDLMDFFNDILGIDTTVSGGAAMVAGKLTVTGNTGTVNALKLNDDNVIVNRTTNPTIPFKLTETAAADGESVRTSFVAYDSLGSEMLVDLNVVLESKSNAGTTWRFYAQSEDDSDLSRLLGNGTLNFDTNGRFLNATNTTITIDRNGTGSLTPQQVTLNFDQPTDSLSALASNQSEIASTQQDGTAIGTLAAFSVTEAGVIRGSFSNGLVRSLGQLVLAQFVNPDGLAEEAGNVFAESASSGNATVTVPGSGGAGRVIGQALELSNVDLSQEFVNLITATTGFTANSRVFTTSDRLIQELLNALR